MERYCSTCQSPQRAAALTEEEKKRRKRRKRGLICEDSALKFEDQLLFWNLLFQYNSTLSVTKSILAQSFSKLSHDTI
jgi:hypothetical protein